MTDTCSRTELCWQYFSRSVFENIFPNGARGDQVSSAKFHFQSYNFKTELEERVCLQKLYLQVVRQVLDFQSVFANPVPMLQHVILILPTTATILRTI